MQSRLRFGSGTEGTYSEMENFCGYGSAGQSCVEDVNRTLFSQKLTFYFVFFLFSLYGLSASTKDTQLTRPRLRGPEMLSTGYKWVRQRSGVQSWPLAQVRATLPNVLVYVCKVTLGSKKSSLFSSKENIHCGAVIVRAMQ